ncbi:extracellular solute-binding protein [Phenylobacterium sp. J367]|uniref:extracellular solute-binding protein n=1 Tax=Phenylobacterium sp. J367 TaxID=2898435 RepID=UPI002150F587|nr:extracellular solute-binding protein [Phenylobacterium sp. J367]MCR5881302.1 extracellular solute-binding protein [Phenylobacterium sp. J367]
MRHPLQMLVAIALLVTAGACSERPPTKPEVVVYTSVDQVFSEPVFRRFEADTGVRVRSVFDTEETKSTGILNRLIAERANPQADVFWSGDPVRPFLLVSRGLVEPYTPTSAAGIPPAFKSAQGHWTGSAARARVLLVNRERLAGRRRRGPCAIWPTRAGGGRPPSPTRSTAPRRCMSPPGSQTGGDAEATRFLDALKANDVRIASSNGEVKRLVTSGEVVFGLTDTDDAFDAVKSGAPVDIVYPDQDAGGTLVMPTSVVLIRGAPHPEAARRLADYLVSPQAERMMVDAAAHMPLHADVATPAHVVPVARIRAMNIDYAALAAVMDRIQPQLRKWSGL